MSRMPLLMLPGLLLDRRLFAAQVEALSDLAEITVGELTGHATVGEVAQHLLARAPERFALLGLSMGGYVALEIMRRAPARVLRLALLDTQARSDDAATTARRLDQIATAERGEIQTLLGQLHPAWVHPERQGDPALMGLLQEMAHAIGPRGFVQEMRVIMSRPDSHPDLARIACPTLVLCGREDAVTPPERHLEMAAAIPDATLVVLPRCGHLAPLEQPAAVTAQLRAWLED